MGEVKVLTMCLFNGGLTRLFFCYDVLFSRFHKINFNTERATSRAKRTYVKIYESEGKKYVSIEAIKNTINRE